MSKNLALFDFDGTLTYKDSFLEVIKFHKGKSAFYKGFMLLSPFLILFKLKLLVNWKAKEMVISYFFKNEKFGDFQKKCDDFALNQIPNMLRPEALAQLKEHIANGDRVILVSASAENWLEAWCRKMGLELIGTQLEIQNEYLTGKLCGPNCYGPEKAKRILAHLNPKDYDRVYVYGDSSGDTEMLALASDPFYRHF